MNTVLLGVLGYVLFQLVVGFVVSRSIRSESDYLIAGRSLGYGLGIFTVFATWFGAETVIGAAGSIYEEGLSGGSADPFGYALCLLVMGFLFAVPLWNLRLTTLADLFRRRYSGGVERMAVVLMVPTSLLWAAAQIRAFGQVLSASSDLEVTVTITLAAAVVVVYTVFGGLLADAWTDLVQGIALIAGLVILFGVLVMNGSVDDLAAVEPARYSLTQRSPLGTVEAWAIPICGSVLAAELVARVIAMKNPTVARRSSLIAGSAYLAIGMIPVTIGLIGFEMVPGLEHPEQILPLMAQQHLPALLYTLFAGALVSAILSTVDSALLVASSLISHNIIVPLRPGMSEKMKVRIARAGVATFGVIAYVVALHAEGVYALVEEASAFGSAGIFTVIVFGLFTRVGASGSAYASLSTGIVLWVLGAYVLELPYPYVTSLAGAMAAYGAGALLEGRQAGNALQREAAPLRQDSHPAER